MASRGLGEVRVGGQRVFTVWEVFKIIRQGPVGVRSGGHMQSHADVVVVESGDLGDVEEEQEEQLSTGVVSDPSGHAA